jgi:hypothetical protein
VFHLVIFSFLFLTLIFIFCSWYLTMDYLVAY